MKLRQFHVGRLFLTGLVVASGLFTTIVPAQTPPISVFTEPVEIPLDSARIIVKFKSDSAVVRKHALPATAGANEALDKLTSRANEFGARLGIKLTAGRALSERSQVIHARGVTSQALAERLAAQEDVEYAVIDERRQHYSMPNDPLFTQGPAINGSAGGPAVGQWYLRAPAGEVTSSIDAPRAWNVTTGSPSIVVAILDTGVRPEHPDLANRLLPGYDMVDNGSIANDGGGRDQDAADPGDWITTTESENRSGAFFNCSVSESSWHGTMTASLVGAASNNADGMAGVAWNIRLLPVRVLGKCGGFDSDIIAGMLWAAGLSVPGVPLNQTPARVINMSLGSSGVCASSYSDAIARVTGKLDPAVIVVSAGNTVGRAVRAPANCPGVIGVGGLRHIGTKVGFSDLGSEIALSAPAGNCVNIGQGEPCLYPILAAVNSGVTAPLASTYTDSFNFSVGTSFSAPLVAGTAALMLSVNPSLGPAEVKAALQTSARAFPFRGAADDPTGVIRDCRAPDSIDQLQCYCSRSVCGAGMLDAASAVAAALGLRPRITLGQATIFPGETVSLLSGQSVVGAGRTIASVHWSIVDSGAIVNGFESGADAALVVLRPSGAGRFSVRLTITDDRGLTGSAEAVLATTPFGSLVQVINFGTLPVVGVGGTGTLSATGGLSGNPVVFTSMTPDICTVNGALLFGLSAGSCVIVATQTGNAIYNAAPQVTQEITVAQASQVISFGTAPTVIAGDTGIVSATGGASGNTVIFSSITPSVCTVSGTTVTGVSAGTCMVAANQSGNANYAAAAQVTQNITVGAAIPTTLAPRVLSTTDHTAVIEWQTDEASSSSVAYGITDLSSNATSQGYVTNHVVALTNLQASTTYRYRATSADAQGNAVRSALLEFTTGATPDITAPKITRGPNLASINPTLAVIVWTTDKATTGSVAYGPTSALGTSIADTRIGLTHQITLPSLTANTRYFVQVSATDLSGNGPTVSPLIDFYTLSTADTTAPKYTQGPMLADISDQRLSVRLTTDEASTVTVTATEAQTQTSRSVSDTTLSREHRLNLQGLTAATTYDISVGVTDALGNGPRMATLTATTATGADTDAPQFLSLPRACTLNHQLARLCWKTNEASDAQADYGTNPANLDERETTSEQRTNHSLPLTGLVANTLYHYRVRVADAAGNVLQSATASFRTSTAPDTTPPVFVGAPQASYTTGDRAVIEWTTDEQTQGVIEYGTSASRTLRAYDTELRTHHQVTITGLAANTPYFVRVIATDAAGNSAAADLPEPP